MPLGGLDVLGSPKTDNMYHAGWAWAGSTPYKGTKLLASHFGGTRNPMAVRWPAKIKPDATPAPAVPPRQRRRPDDLRSPRHHAAARRQRRPARPDRRRQLRLHVRRREGEGPQAHPVFRDHGQPRHLPRRLDRLRVRPARPWVPGLPPGIREWTPDKDKWELYNLEDDWTPGQRPRRQDAGEAGAHEGPVPDRGREESRLSHRRRALGPRAPPGAADRHALHGVDFPRRHHAACRSSAPGARQQAERRHRSTPRSRTRPTACSTRSAASPAASPAT